MRDGDTMRLNRCPVQAQFDFTSGMEERDYFTVVVTESAKTTALSTNLDTSPGWTVGTDEWTHGVPNFESAGQQPGFDYPHDPVLSVNQKCYYTGDDTGTTGAWDLDTATFDLTGADVGVVSYALWFYARNATHDTHKFNVFIYDNPDWVLIQEIDVTGGEDEAVARVRWIRQRVRIPGAVDLTSGMKLRFQAIGDTSPEGFQLEACVDEVRVWGVHEP